MYCKKCGKTVDPHAKFCSNCGAEIKEEKISFDFDRPSKHTEPEKKKIHVTKENFKWDLDGFPSEDKNGTEDVVFNWDSVIDTKRRDRSVMDEPISFTEKKAEPAKKEETEEEIKIEPVPEKYELSDLFGDDVKKYNSEETDEKTEVIEEDDDIMELSFEDEIFGDLKDEKPASATIRISQTIHFTDQLYSFDNKQAEYQSILDAEYDKLQNNNDDDEEEVTAPVVAEPEEVKSFEDMESREPEFRTGIESDDFLRELYGTTEPEEAETEEKAECEENPVTEDIQEEVPEEDNASEIMTEEPAAEEVQEESETEKPTFISIEEITEDKEDAEAAEETPSEAVEEIQEEPEEEEVQEEEPEEEAAEEEPEEEAPAEEPEEETPAEEPEEAEEEIICEESVPADGLDCIGVALARTPRGVLIIQKSNKEKLTRRTILPSKETKDTEENGNTETEKENRGLEKQSEKDRNEKLTFGDVFNDIDDDYDDDDYKPKKKGKALRIIAIILFIAILAEVAFIGIQHFAPDSSVAKQLNSLYNKVLEKIIPGDEPEVIEEEDFVVTSPVNDYVVAEEGKYKNIAKITTDVELKFAENADFDLEGFADAGTFTDGEWFKDESGNGVTYGQAVVKSVCGYYSSLTDYKNDENEDVMDLITENSPVEKEISEFEAEDAVYAVNSLVIGEIRTSTSGIYVAAKVEETNNKAESPETKNVVIYLRPVEHELKVDSIVYL